MLNNEKIKEILDDPKFHNQDFININEISDINFQNEEDQVEITNISE
jgi:hypothetical protein